MYRKLFVVAALAGTLAGALPSPATGSAEPPILRLYCAVQAMVIVIYIIDTEPSGMGTAVEFCRNVLGGHPFQVTRAKPPAGG